MVLFHVVLRILELQLPAWMCFALCGKATSLPLKTLRQLYFEWRAFVLSRVQEHWTDAKWTKLTSSTYFKWWDVFPSVTQVTSSLCPSCSDLHHTHQQTLNKLSLLSASLMIAMPYHITWHSWNEKSCRSFTAERVILLLMLFSLVHFFLELITSISWVTYARISNFITVKCSVVTQHMGMHWQVFSWKVPQDLDEQIDHS